MVKLSVIVHIFLILSLAGHFNPCIGNTQSDSLIIRGQIVGEENQPLAYANIFIQETMNGVMSDENGRFELVCPIDPINSGCTLLCAYMGYESFSERLTPLAERILERSIRLREIVFESQPMTVTASSFITADTNGVTLNSLEIVRTPGAAADVFWAIKSYPGLQQVDEGAGLFVRGGEMSETVILLDGARISHPYKFESPTGGFFGAFTPFLLKGSYFSSGGYSARYGNALSGVLAMESLDLPTKTHFSLGLGLAAFSAMARVPLINDKLGFSFSGNLSHTGALFRFNHSRRSFSSFPASSDVNLNLVFKPHPNHQIKLFLFMESDQVGVAVDDPVHSGEYAGKTVNRIINLGYRGLAGRWFIESNLCYELTEQQKSMAVMELDQHDRSGQFTIHAERRLRSKLLFRAGGGGWLEQSQNYGQVPYTQNDLNPFAAVYTLSIDHHSFDSWGFSEIEWKLNPKATITPGFRLETTYPDHQYRAEPRLSVNYSIATRSVFTLATGLYHQSPDHWLTDPDIGNPDLAPAKAIHYIAGYSYARDDRMLRLESYYKDYRHLPLESESVNYTSDGNGHAWGVDAFLKESFGALSTRISYSYLHARRRWRNSPHATSPLFDITHNLNLVINYDLNENWSFGGGYRYATGKPYSSSPTTYHDDRVPAYSKTDLTIQYIVSLFPGNMTILYLAIANLFNRDNILDYAYSDDYSQRIAVKSAFRRSIYFGLVFNR